MLGIFVTDSRSTSLLIETKIINSAGNLSCSGERKEDTFFVHCCLSLSSTGFSAFGAWCHLSLAHKLISTDQFASLHFHSLHRGDSKKRQKRRQWKIRQWQWRKFSSSVVAITTVTTRRHLRFVSAAAAAACQISASDIRKKVWEDWAAAAADTAAFDLLALRTDRLQTNSSSSSSSSQL